MLGRQHMLVTPPCRLLTWFDGLSPAADLSGTYWTPGNKDHSPHPSNYTQRYKNVTISTIRNRIGLHLEQRHSYTYQNYAHSFHVVVFDIASRPYLPWFSDISKPNQWNNPHKNKRKFKWPLHAWNQLIWGLFCICPQPMTDDVTL